MDGSGPADQTVATGYWRIAGHRGLLLSLAGCLNNPAHAYLFLGPRQVGKTRMGIELAKALNCLAEPGARPCQNCSECRLVEREIHPDVSFLRPNEKENILIEQARQLRQQLTLRPNQGRWRVVILPADLLTESASDALLKTLEEPSPNVVLVLTGHDLDAIPETVVSRCRTCLFGLVETSDILSELMSRCVEQVTAEEIAGLARGAMGWAIEASQDGELLARRRAMRDDLMRWTGGSPLDRLDAAEGLASSGGKLDTSRRLALEELELTITWWRDVLAASAGRPDLVLNSTELDAIESASRGQDPPSVVRVIRAISTAATRIGENVDPRLALEALAAS